MQRDQVESTIAKCREAVQLVDSTPVLDVVQRRGRIDVSQLVTVIIPMRNAAVFVERSVKSVLMQSHHDLEVWCVDDASTDDTFSRVSDLFGRDFRVRAVRLAHRVGPYQIKNWVLTRAVRGGFVAMQDADDCSHPRRIECQLAAMRHLGALVCGTSVHQVFPASLPPRYGGSAFTDPSDPGTLHSLATYLSLGPLWQAASIADLVGEPRKNYIAKHGSQVFRHWLLRALGGFDGRTLFGADTDLNWRLLRLTRVYNLQRVLYTRRHHLNSLTRDPTTGIGSPARDAYEERRDARDAEVQAALVERDRERMRSLCTEDCYHGDVVVEAIIGGAVE